MSKCVQCGKTSRDGQWGQTQENDRIVWVKTCKVCMAFDKKMKFKGRDISLLARADCENELTTNRVAHHGVKDLRDAFAALKKMTPEEKAKEAKLKLPLDQWLQCDLLPDDIKEKLACKQCPICWMRCHYDVCTKLTFDQCVWCSLYVNKTTPRCKDCICIYCKDNQWKKD